MTSTAPASIWSRIAARSRRASGLVVFAFAFELSTGCAHDHSLTAAQIDRIHAGCRRAFESGRYRRPGLPKLAVVAPKPAGTPVMIYGASWCSACDMATSYMTARGIPFVEKDVEEDPSAATELDSLVASARLSDHGLPVIDVRGTVMSGFTPCAVEEAWTAP